MASSHLHPLASSSTAGVVAPAAPGVIRPPLMASISQTGDIALWLHNKLGTSNDTWSDNSSIISQLNNDVLRQIKDIFVELQMNVKMKLLLSFLHISRRNLDDWKIELERILQCASEDPDPWVSVVGEMLRNFPRNGTVNFDFQSNNSNFMDLVNDMKKIIKKIGSTSSVLPLESLFLNKNVLENNFGKQPPLPKHFTLRRKAKSATLRAELLIKAGEAASGKRSTAGPSVPIRCRGLNSDSTPLKGIPSRNSFGGSGGYNSYNSSGYGAKSGLARVGSLGSSGTPSSGPLNRLSRFSSLGGSTSLGSGPGKRDGGIVLLDITEAPSTLKDPKRRKTVTVQEDKKGPKNQDSVEGGAAPAAGSVPAVPVTGAPAAASTSPTTTPTIPMVNPGALSSIVLGHKSVSEELPSILKKPITAAITPDPYELREPTGISLVNPARVTSPPSTPTPKATPDYAAGLLGSSSASSPAARYGSLHHDLHTNIKAPSLSSLLAGPPPSSSASSSTASSSSSNNPPPPSNMYSSILNKTTSPLDSILSSSLASSNMATNGSGAGSSSISYNPSYSPSVSSGSPTTSPTSPTNSFFKPAVLNAPRLQQQTPQRPPPVPAPQAPQVPNSYRNYVNFPTNLSTQPQGLKGQAQQVQPPSAHQQPAPTNTMYGVINQAAAQQQQSQLGQRLFQGAPIQAQPNTPSVIHANPQTIQQPQQQQSMYGAIRQQQQQPPPQQQQQNAPPPSQARTPFGMYSQQAQARPQVQLQPPQANTPPQPVQQQQQQVQAAPQRLIIAREVTQQAAQIFNSSNTLTRPEKALILGFMAGTQANPAPHMGPVSMIKYLEKMEEHRTTSGAAVRVVVEEHFQMNFSTNEWKTVRSIRQAEPNQTVGGNDQGNQTRIVVLDPSQQHHFVVVNQGRSQPPMIGAQAGVVQPGAGGLQAPMGNGFPASLEQVRPGSGPGYMRV